MPKLSVTAVADFAERVGATFAQAFLAVLIANSTGVLNVGGVHDLEIAALAGGLAAAKYVLLKLNSLQTS